MLPKELAKKVRYIEIHTRKAVNDVLAGEYHSVFKGRGVEFEEVREYQPGDEVRTIDWNVTARMGKPFVKRYREERELTIMFVVDLSASGAFGSVHMTKNEVATELCALLAFSAVKNNDKVGLIVFTDTVELFIPPEKGVSHVLRLIRELLAFTPRQTRTNIALALDFFGRVQTKRCVAFLVSDFQGEDYDKPMRILGKKHDLVAVSVGDPREVRMPNVGLVELEDAETGELVLLDTGNRAARTSFETLGVERAGELRTQLASMDIDQIEVGTDREYVRDLMAFFRRRERRH